MKLTIELSEYERVLAENYAKLHGLSKLLRKLFLKRLKMNMISLLVNLHMDYIKSGKKSRPVLELWQELDL